MSHRFVIIGRNAIEEIRRIILEHLGSAEAATAG
jgi:hypothetical protein